MSNPALLSRQEMLGSSGKCLNHFCIIYSRYLASSTGNEFSIWKRVTECPRQEINLRSLSLKTDLGSLNTPNPFLHRIIAPAASWTRCSFTHSSLHFTHFTLYTLLYTLSFDRSRVHHSSRFIEKSYFSYSRNCSSNIVY